MGIKVGPDWHIGPETMLHVCSLLLGFVIGFLKSRLVQHSTQAPKHCSISDRSIGCINPGNDDNIFSGLLHLSGSIPGVS